ncbi:MAG: 50S ribosomal protein L15 [Planctomycetota bacterium]|jgi:large subunit ribosomal protein L15|nr:50S ribosomal protein L15 [Planctomycetota bacterium]
MNLTDVFNSVKAHQRRKRIGRGAGSGHGKTAGRGQKGLGSRTGANFLRGYVGGQTQLKNRLPKVGFNNAVHATVYLPVNLAFLDQNFENGDTVDFKSLRAKGFQVRRGDLVKLLGSGELTRKLTVKVNAASASAKEKVEKAGGMIELIPLNEKAGKVKDAVVEK